MVRKIIISLCLFMVVMLQWINNAVALKDLQLHIPGGSYVVDSEDTWFYTFTPGSPFTLQVFSTLSDSNNSQVYVSLALDNAVFPNGSSLSSISIGLVGSENSQTLTGSNFSWGNPFHPTGGGNSHSIFQTYYADVKMEDFANFSTGTIFNVETGEDSQTGKIASIDVTISGYYSTHFDAYRRDSEGNYISGSAAPFSHDAEAQPVPEPATLALLSIGIVSLLGYKGRKFLKKS